jgi:hypothetical protein
MSESDTELVLEIPRHGGIRRMDWWDARNILLHQGRSRESARYQGFIFSPPGGPGHKLVDPASNRLRLDVWSLANEMMVALERWFDALLEDPKSLACVEKHLPELVWSDPAESSPKLPS